MMKYVALSIACSVFFCWTYAAETSGAAAGHVPGPLLSAFLDGPLADVEEIVFAVRQPGRDHWYVNFGNYAKVPGHEPDRPFKHADGVAWGYPEGGRLCRLNLRTGKLTVILEDAKGGVRDPQVHYQGEKILFSYRKGGEHAYHLYEINVDGSGLVQLTDGPDDDIEPSYCPDGGIVFCSSRCRRFVNCWYTRVATLHRCDGDGRNVRMISSNIEHDNTPWVLPDGRILYMRWEYVDRSQVNFHHLWTINPDGIGQMVYFGNQHPGITMIDAKPIPGTKKVVASFSPGHGRNEHLGYVTVVDPRCGPDDLPSAHSVSKGSRWQDAKWRDPYAMSEDCFLVAHREGISVMDGDGNHELVYGLPDSDKPLQCHEPRPLRPRLRERVIPTRTDLARASGRLILQDIYHGRNMPGVARGKIKKLLVLKQLPKPVNFSGWMAPISIGGTFTLAEILGTVPVEPDGSAYMEVPALESLFFVALDENDVAVKRMHSFVTLQPGETTGCVGCHEKRVETPQAALADPIAMRRLPSAVEPIRDVPSVLDYPRDVQPILDRHCVGCHNPERREGGVELTGDHTPMFSVSYWAMVRHGLVSDGRNEPLASLPPRSSFSAASRLLSLIDGSHYDAKLSELEARTVRLWIDTSATYAGTYGSLGSGMYGVELPADVLARRCGVCHGREVDLDKLYSQHYRKLNEDCGWPMAVDHFQFGAAGPPQPLDSRVAQPSISGRRCGTFKYGEAPPHQSLCNLTRPGKSLLLRAPLSERSGGLALCGKNVFADTADPDYQAILAVIVAASDQLARHKRFDMPGFRPNEHYVREMQRFGILPASLGPTDPVDVYATDRAYWDSFAYQP